MSAVLKPIDGRKVAIYIRWSTDDQTDGTTLDVQLAGCQHYLLSQGWEVTEDLTFVDDGYSGGNMDRPALTRLRGLVKKGRIDCVVVFKVDRLSRSVMDTVNLVLNEWDGRTYLKSAREPIDTTTAMGKQFFYMLVSYAEWERSVIRERTVAGRRRRAEEGYKPSAIAPFGYQHSPTRKGALEIVPAEVEVVREIFRLANSGMGGKAITNHLTRTGSRYRGGALWSEATVRYMLRNCLYCGDMVYGKRQVNPRYGKEPGETKWLKTEPVVVENSPFIPPIINREQFRMAQEMLVRRQLGPGKPSGRANASPYLLTGVARCRCGSGLWVKIPSWSTGAYTYCCIAKRNRGVLQCDAAPIPMNDLDAEIERRFKARFGSEAAKEAFLQRMQAGHEQEMRLKATELEQANRLLADLEEQEKKVRRDYRTDRISAEEFRELKRELDEEARQLQEQRTGLENAIAELEEKARSNQAVKAQLDRVDQWDSLAATEKKNVLRFFISRLEAYRRPGEATADILLEWVSAGR